MAPIGPYWPWAAESGSGAGPSGDVAVEDERDPDDGSQDGDDEADAKAVKRVFSCFCWGGERGGGGGEGKPSILGRFPAQPGPGRAWERPPPGSRSICTDFQPGRPTLRPFHDLAVLKMILIFVLGSPPPGGSRGRVRTAIFLRIS